MSGDERSAFRRTKRTAAAVGAATLLTFVATAPGSAQPGAPAQEAFNNGTGSAIALGYKVNPTNGNLSFGITAGESVAGHQNTAATGQSRAINLGVIGVTLAGEGCDGGEATMPAEQQPQPVIVSSGDKGAAEGRTESEANLITKFARATTAPYGEAITTIAPLGDPAAIYIDGGRTISHSGVVDGTIREAFARTELGEVSIAGGAVKLQGLAWEAIHRSGAKEEMLGTFSIGSLVIGGQAVPLEGDASEQLAQLQSTLATVGIKMTPPQVRTEQGIVFVDPLKIGIVPNAERDSVLAPIVSGVQPLRDVIVDALLEQDCGNATYITIADIVLGSVSGAGALTLELGGVQATTAAIDRFQFASLPPLPALPPTPSLGGAGLSAAPVADVGTVAAPPAPAEPSAPAVTEETPIEPIADFTGERGGLMALIAGGGLLLLLGTAEADRRKMRSALRAIPLEA